MHRDCLGVCSIEILERERKVRERERDPEREREREREKEKKMHRCVGTDSEFKVFEPESLITFSFCASELGRWTLDV